MLQWVLITGSPAQDADRTVTAPTAATSNEPRQASATGGAAEVAAQRVEAGPVLDGRLDDPVWSLAPAADSFLQVEPVAGAQPSERTEFRVVYDADALYIGVWCYDREPEKIIALEMARDGYVLAEDHLIVVLDTFHDRRNGYEFLTNPNAARADALITNNVNVNGSWDGIWEVKARIDDEGWKAELAIPFKTLSFDPQSPTWGLNISRTIGRSSETMRWSGHRPDFSTYNVAEAGVLSGLEGLRQGLGLELLPYALGRFTNDRPSRDDDLELEVGGDVLYRVTPNLTATLSYNTDFAETEVDLRQVNLTRFPLFFPEKRSFFLEDSGIFHFGGLGNELIPYFSRRVGLSSEGEAVPIVVAGKLAGRVGDFNVGAIDALLDTDEHGLRNAFVARLSRHIFEQASVGMIATLGDPDSSDDNVLGGADFSYRTSKLLGEEIFLANAFLMGTSTESQAGDDSLAFGANFEMPNDLYTASAGFYQVDADFNPALGFAPRRGVRNYSGIFRYRPRLESVDAIRQIFFNYLTSSFTDLSNELETAEHNIWPLYILFESADELYFSYNWQFDAPGEDFEISPGVVIPPDEYWWQFYRVGFLTARKRQVSVGFDYFFGEFYDGDKDTYMVSMMLKPSRYVALDLGYRLDRVRLPEGDFDTRLASARVQLTVTPDLAWSNLVQYDNITETIGYNSRIRWEFRPGAQLFLVLNQSIDRNHSRLRWERTEATVKLGLSFRF